MHPELLVRPETATGSGESVRLGRIDAPHLA